MASRTKSKKPSSRKHAVKAELANFQLAKAKSALKLEIYSRGEKVGEIQLGRGSLYWWGKHRVTPKRVNWERFTDMMNELAYGEKR